MLITAFALFTRRQMSAHRRRARRRTPSGHGIV